jgi:hypothetical protein
LLVEVVFTRLDKECGLVAPVEDDKGVFGWRGKWGNFTPNGLFGKWRNQVDGRGLKGILGNFDL